MRRICWLMMLPDCSFHFPHFLGERFATEVVAIHALRGELAFDHDLRRDPRVIGAGITQRLCRSCARGACMHPSRFG